MQDDLIAQLADAVAEKRGVKAEDRVEGMMSVWRMNARAMLEAYQATVPDHAGDLLAALIALRSSHDTEAGRFQARYNADRLIAQLAPTMEPQS